MNSVSRLRLYKKILRTVNHNNNRQHNNTSSQQVTLQVQFTPHLPFSVKRWTDRIGHVEIIVPVRNRVMIRLGDSGCSVVSDGDG